MGILIMTGAPIGYSGTRGTGPVLPDGKQVVHIAGVVGTFDNVNNPFGDLEGQTEKKRNYDDVRPVLAIKYSNPLGAVTERYHLFGFLQFSELSEADKASGQFKADPDTGYALARMLDDKGQPIHIEKGTVTNGAADMRVAITRVISEKNTGIAQRILKDALVACRVPALTEDLSPAEFIEYAVDGVAKCTSAIEITVTSKMYDDKRIARVNNPREIGTAVPTATEATKAPVTKANDDF